MLKKIKYKLSTNSYMLALAWFYRLFIKKSNSRLIKKFDKINIKSKKIKSYISSNDIILDIGSHGGSWAFFLSALVPKGKVICFEALPLYSKALRNVVTLSTKKNIIVRNAAVLNKNKTVSITWKDEKNNRLTGMTRLSKKGDMQSQKLKVKGIKIDDFFNNFDDKVTRISFIKMDIEGAELFALQGSLELIKKNKPIIILEFVPAHMKNFNINPNELYQFFSEINYYPVCSFQLEPNFLDLSLKDFNFNDDIVFAHKNISQIRKV
ncbi:FkbM family methyltransferase [Alphaproteobacteria bacterium]|nr:FkbM family methyltransferase [Alphaproteobacteria bacterium]